jgi:hypothetical protein
MKKLLKIAFIAMMMIIAASWLTTVAYGHDNNNLQLNGEPAQDIQITSALTEDAPAATFYGNAIGGVTPGDLFYINAANTAPDITVNINLTNTDRLVHILRYMNLEIGIYGETTPGQWEKVQFPQTFLTMVNGTVTFDLPGMTNYKVTVEGGCFKAQTYNANQENVAPAFYCEAAYK